MKYIIYFIIFIVFYSNIYAGNFTVSNVTQFQTALNTAASNGQNDTINVLAGTYNVNPELTYNSSQNYFLLIRGSGSPVFDGANARRILQLTTSSANGDISLEGLTIQHGRADNGGGLNIATTAADINITNCTFTDNTANFIAGGVNLFSNTGNITVTNCTFRRNSSPNTSGYPYGTAGGLFVQTDGTGTIIKLTGSIFETNSAQRDAAGAMLYPLGLSSTVIAEFNTCNNNNAKEFGGGCWIRCPGGNTVIRYRNNTLTGNLSSVAGSGGGTYIQITSGQIDLFDNIHNGNTSTWQGGGLWIEHGGGTLNFYRNRFNNNFAAQSGGGANIFLDNGSVKMDHNVFYRNRTSGEGGGMNLSTTTGSVNIFNNTFYLNTSTDGGDVYLYFDNSSARANFYNNILYNSSLPALSYSGQQSVIAKYSDIKGGNGQPWFGTGCIDRYPFFADTAANDYHLQDSVHCTDARYSPCIDAGNPDVQDSILHCDWGLGTFRSDMGAYGGKGTVIGIKKINEIIPVQFSLSQNYPNPFNPLTKIKFAVPPSPRGEGLGAESSVSFYGVRLIIYDALGREVQTLVNEQLQSGTYGVEWDGSNFSSGVYYYTLTSSDYFESKKMVLIK